MRRRELTFFALLALLSGAALEGAEGTRPS